MGTKKSWLAVIVVTFAAAGFVGAGAAFGGKNAADQSKISSSPTIDRAALAATAQGLLPDLPTREEIIGIENTSQRLVVSRIVEFIERAANAEGMTNPQLNALLREISFASAALETGLKLAEDEIGQLNAIPGQNPLRCSRGCDTSRTACLNADAGGVACADVATCRIHCNLAHIACMSGCISLTN